MATGRIATAMLDEFLDITRAVADFPNGLAWYRNDGTGTALRTQAENGTALEVIGPARFARGTVTLTDQARLRIDDGAAAAGHLLVAADAEGTLGWQAPREVIPDDFAVFVEETRRGESAGEFRAGEWRLRRLNDVEMSR